MPQASILAPGNTDATSTNVVVAQGAVAVIGIYSAAAGTLPPGNQFSVVQVTPGADNFVVSLGNDRRTVMVSGPGTFKIKRPAYTGAAFGAFSET